MEPDRAKEILRSLADGSDLALALPDPFCHLATMRKAISHQPPEWDVEFKLRAPQQTTVEGTVRGGKLVALNVTPEPRRADVVVLPPLQDPTAFVAEPTRGEVPLPVRFDGAPAAKMSGKVVSYHWDFGDGATAGDATVAHTCEKAGTYQVSLQLKMASNYAIAPDVKVAAASLGADDSREKCSCETKTLLARLSDPSCRLGRTVQIGRLFRGNVSDVRICRKALSPADVQAVMKETGERK